MNIQTMTKGFALAGNKMESIDLTKVKHQLITLPAIWLCVIFAAGWMGKVWIAEAVGVTPIEAHDRDIKKLAAQGEERDKAIQKVGETVDGLASEIRITWAYQMIERADTNLAEHMQEKNHNAPNWESDRRRLESKLRLANEYKSCVLSNGDNCAVIQRQILQ